jgi:glutathione S-transferase
LATRRCPCNRQSAASAQPLDHFSLVDCAAAPALYYANLVSPFGDSLPATCAYLDRLMQRPSFARVLAEAQPYFHFFPQEPGEKA